jgi:hypothetical protein
MKFLLSIYFNNKPLHFSSSLTAHHQEDLLCIDSNPAGPCQQPVNITPDYANCCLYRLVPPDDEQQACSKLVEAYY